MLIIDMTASTFFKKKNLPQPQIIKKICQQMYNQNANKKG